MLAIYCQRIKSTTDELRELGGPIPDCQLINILLASLNECFEK
jgi:hypothetical protein